MILLISGDFWFSVSGDVAVWVHNVGCERFYDFVALLPVCFDNSVLRALKNKRVEDYFDFLDFSKASSKLIFCLNLGIIGMSKFLIL